ncbi:MAG: class I SAM-dependent methyltransferase [Candidatus Omnitrophota bacterium]|nr:class I SAM-dependent methyltransferase [Candidatus Omnitrophota bacterium]
MVDLKSHWEKVYQTKRPTEVSWFQPHLAQSLEIISRMDFDRNVEIIDIGGGASALVDDLLNHGYRHMTVLDMSQEALNISKRRLGGQSKNVTWIEGDITAVDLPQHHYDLWHDRAVFHFLTRADERYRYMDILKKTLKPGGHVIIATFGPQGPTHCSGLDVARYSPEGLLAELGQNFKLAESLEEDHKTPGGTAQKFIYCHFIRGSSNAK